MKNQINCSEKQEEIKILCCEAKSIKLTKMKYYRTARKLFALVGIKPDQFHFPFNGIYLVINLMGSIGLISGWIFIFYVADSVEEYMNSFYALIVGCSIGASYTNTIFNMKKLFKFFDDSDSLLDDGKYSSIVPKFSDENFKQFKQRITWLVSSLLESICGESRAKHEMQLHKTNDLVEVLTEVMYFVTVIVLPSALTLPKTIASFYAYFTTDAGSDAFELTLPVW